MKTNNHEKLYTFKYDDKNQENQTNNVLILASDIDHARECFNTNYPSNHVLDINYAKDADVQISPFYIDAKDNTKLACDIIHLTKFAAKILNNAINNNITAHEDFAISTMFVNENVRKGTIVINTNNHAGVVVDYLDADNIDRPIIKMADLKTKHTEVDVDYYILYNPSKEEQQTAKDILIEYESNDEYELIHNAIVDAPTKSASADEPEI